jgi:hypothetical protein
MVLAGLATFVLVTVALRDRSATVEVLVAAEAIEAGTPLAGAALRPVPVDAGSGVVDALVPEDEADLTLTVARPLVAGEPVLRSDLVPGASAAGLRTVALPVEHLVLDGLGLRVGDRVDVVAVDAAGVSRFVAVGVRVARLPGPGPVGLGRSAESSSWLTVEVSDQQALDLAAASAGGDLVVVRSTGVAPPRVATGGDAAGSSAATSAERGEASEADSLRPDAAPSAAPAAAGAEPTAPLFPGAGG